MKLPAAIAILLLLAAGAAAANDNPLQELLAQYVNKPDPSYNWHVLCATRYAGGDYAELLMASQTWHGLVWRHHLYIIRPDSTPASIHSAALFITGGHWRPQDETPATVGCRHNPDAGVYLGLAASLHMPLAVLQQVPEEPLFGGKTEDALIAYSFQKYLATRDPSWPLLMPMVNSAVRAMDTVQSYTRERWQENIRDFLVFGVSKRGWTTWLTAAVDPRVKAIAPMSFSMLDIPQQLHLQQTLWGRLSNQIADYSRTNLTEKVQAGQAHGLMQLVDPWNYRNKIHQPKLVVDGTNDPYWPVVSANIYWPSLAGDKYLLYLPNNGHDPTDYRRLFADLAALACQMNNGTPLAKLHWRFIRHAGHIQLRLWSNVAPDRVRIWRAYSTTHDFRNSLWLKTPVFCRQKACDYSLKIPKNLHMAVFGEAQYPGPGHHDYYLSTQVWAGGP
ncbi:MAG: hypothetical protein KGK44_02950 [Gammaproteobacteria bacterium]|nr:hypothetical protein [Gammaproteobacteria bacterium]